MSYPSDLSDAQWEKVAPLFARPDPRGAREKHPKRPVQFVGTNAGQIWYYRVNANTGQNTPYTDLTLANPP